MTTEELEARLSHFICAFEGLFDNDWDFTIGNLSDEFRDLFVSNDGTFLNPNVADEHNNWNNRGVLLDAYRDLIMVMKERGIYSVPNEG